MSAPITAEERPFFEEAAYARQLTEEGRCAEALEVCAQILAHTPSHADVQFTQGFALILLERWEEAQTALEGLLASHPTYPDAAWMRAGVLRHTCGDHAPEVLAAYDLALTSNPANLQAQIERADVLRACSRYTEARDIYTRLQHPDVCQDEQLRLDATFGLGCVALVLQEKATAQSAFRTVLTTAPDYPDAQEIYDLLCAEGDTT